jgi:hypothetical protein
MARKADVKPNDLGKYFKEIDLKGRLGVIESAKTLLKLQNKDDALLAEAYPVDTPLKEKKDGITVS